MSNRFSSLALLMLLAGGLISVARAHDGALCQSTAPSLAKAKAALAALPDSLQMRFKLADALLNANCYDEAVHTLEAGEAIHPRNSELQAKLRNARSFVNEQSYFAGRDQAELAARLSRNLLRCNKIGDLNACDEALKLKANDPELLLSKGDALLKVSRPAEAELAYRRVRQVAPDNARAGSQLAVAQTQRVAMVSQCQRASGDDALKACQGALLPGSGDEFAIQSRLGLLYQQRNQPAAALASYIAANALKPGDQGVALGIVALTDSRTLNDAVASAARASALRALGRDSSAPRAAAAATPAAAPAAPVVQVARARTYSNAAEPSRSH